MPDPIVQFAFTRGLDTKTDKHSRLPGGADLVVNGVFDKLGAIQKRHGNAAQPATCISPNPPPFALVGPSTLPSQPFGMFGFNAEQCILDKNRLYSLAPGQAAQLSRDYVPEGVATRRPLQNLAWNTAFVDPDCLVLNGYEVWVWQTLSSISAGAVVNMAVYEIATGALVQAPTIGTLSTRGLAKLSAPTATTAVVTYVDSLGNVYARTLDTTNIGAGWGAETAIATGATLVYDHSSAGDGFFVVSIAVAAGNVSVGRLAPTTYTGTAVNITTSDALASICIAATTAETLYVAWQTTTGIVRAWGGNPTTLAQTFALFQVASAQGAGGQIGLARISATRECVVWTSSAQSQGQWQGGMQLITSGGATSGALCPFYDLVLSSRPVQYNGKTYALCYYPSAVQGTYFWCDLNTDFGGTRQNGTDYWPRVVAASGMRLALSSSTATPQRDVSTLSNAAQLSAGVFIAPGSIVIGTGLVGQLRLWRMKLDFTAPARARGGALGRSYVFGNSVYDGQMATELGFYLYPENCTATAQAGAGLGIGLYQYMIVYGWTTATGETIRSTGQPGSGQTPATQALSVTTTNGNQQVGIGQIPILNLSAKVDGEIGNETPVFVEIYRTAVGGGFTFQLVTRLTMSGANGPPGKTLSYTDTMSDATLASQPPLYFSPGFQNTVLENVCPPSFSDVWIHKTRIFGIGDDLRTVWFSKQYVEGQQPGFNEGLTLTIQEGNDLIAGFSIDDKFVVCTKYNTWYCYGDGPDPTGSTGAFSAPQRLAADVGCIDPRSIVTTPDGVLFQSLKGLVLLTRALEVIYLDGPEDVVRTYPVFTSGTLFPEYQEARWTIQKADGSAGIVLVCSYWQPDQPYKYRYSQFQLYDAAAGAAAVPAAGAYIAGSFRWIAATGNAYTEDTAGTALGAYMDGGTALANWVQLKVTTSWLMANGFAGYQRCKRVMPVGDWYTSHDLSIAVATEFNPSTLGPTGNADTFRSDAVEGLAFERAMIAVARQKATAIQVTISDAYPTGAEAVVGTGRGMSLAGIGLRIATKGAMGKLLPPAQRA